MYVPTAFAEPDEARLHDFMRRNSFATLVTTAALGIPTASHIPLLLDVSAGRSVLMGHVAKANDQWRNAEGQSALAIFSGPHAYISPTWYEAKNTVPTWNYVAVHAYGTLRLINDRPRLADMLRRLVDFYEANMPRPWSIDSLEANYLDGMLDGIVGFEIQIERLEGKWKLNQNHTAERQAKVIAALQVRDDPQGQEIAELMSQIK